MTGRRTPALHLGAWLVLLAVVLVVLTATGPAAPPRAPDRWGEWVRATPPVEAAFALLRLAALAAGWYLAAVTVVGLGVRLVRAPRLTAATDRLTVAPVRRLLAGIGVATVGLAGGVAPPAGPTLAVAAVQAPVATPPEQQSPVSTITMRRLPPTDQPAPPAAAPTEAMQEVAPGTSSWTVGPGECFWSIADQVLTRAWGRPATDHEVAPYWQRLIEANRPALVDASNPDLVYPGQTFTVPAP